MVEADALGKLPDDYREVLVLLIPALTMEKEKGTSLISTDGAFGDAVNKNK
jgi:hypothetical protein